MKTFVTSFGLDMYEASGKGLIESFLKHQPTGQLVVGYEGKFPLSVLQAFGPQIRWHDLFSDSFLPRWLHANRDKIPDYLGGTAPECQCPNREARHAKHKHGCHWQWMNRNASRWFRKVATLRAAALTHAVPLRVDPAEPLVWLDSDTAFVAELPDEFLKQKLTGVGMFYFRGHRPAVESGILGFDLARGGEVAIAELCRRYVSRDYIKCERWDDGYQIAKMIDTDLNRLHKFRDLVHPTQWKGKTNNVIPTTEIHAYLRHDKGFHSREADIMK